MSKITNVKPVTILVVEDEAIVRMVTSEVLEEAGFNVVEASNAGEALELLDARPDASLLLTDVKMPGELDGYSLSRLVRMKSATIGIIVVSGDSPPEESDLPPDATFVPKPLSPSMLLRVVRDTLAQSVVGSDQASPAPQGTLPDASLVQEAGRVHKVNGDTREPYSRHR